jgi:hypothetical protein
MFYKLAAIFFAVLCIIPFSKAGTSEQTMDSSAAIVTTTVPSGGGGAGGKKTTTTQTTTTTIPGKPITKKDLMPYIIPIVSIPAIGLIYTASKKHEKQIKKLFGKIRKVSRRTKKKPYPESFSI